MQLDLMKNNNKMMSRGSSLVSSVFLTAWCIYGAGAILQILLSFIIEDRIFPAFFATQASILLLALIFYNMDYKSLFKEINFKLTKRDLSLVVIFTFLIFLANFSLSMLDSMFNLFPKPTTEKATTTELLKTTGILMLIFPVIIAPITEELAFRAGFKKFLVDNSGWKPYQYVLISSLTFSLLHLPGVNYQVNAIFLITLIGVLNAILYLKTKNIVLPILTHVLYNSIILYMAYQI